MSNKLSPIVVPVVIDSSGVDKGMRTAKNKMRAGAVSAGNAGVIGGGGGGINIGGLGSGGSGFASMAFAAAVGARAAAISNSGRGSSRAVKPSPAYNPKPYASFEVWKEQRDFQRSSFIGRKLMDRQTRITSSLGAQSDALSSVQGMMRPYAEASYRKNLNRGTQQMLSLSSWAHKASSFKRFRQQAYSDIGLGINSIGSGFKSFMNSSAAATAGMSIGGSLLASKALLNTFSPSGIASNFSDIRRFEGTKDYQHMAGFKRRNENNQFMDMGQAFYVGASKRHGSPETSTRLEQLAGVLVDGVNRIAGYLGAGAEMTAEFGYGTMEKGLYSMFGMSREEQAIANAMRKAMNVK